MFDPSRLNALLTLENKDLALLPAAEDERYEYKSSLTKDNDLAEKVARAASGFWNSGGGLFVAGVNGQGQPDGGIPLLVGRQPRRDWIDQAISRVAPRGNYVVHCIEDRGAGAGISAGNAVVLVGFAVSEAGPHMAPDNRYYIRAGAHTVSASHFIVEALYAKRHSRRPKLTVLPSVNHFTNVTGFLHIEIISATDGVALEVQIDFDPRPTVRETPLPLVVPIIDREHPFSFRFEIAHQPVFTSTIRISYRDFAGVSYSDEYRVDVSKCLDPWYRDAGAIGGIIEEIRDLKRTIGRINHGTRPYYQE